MYMMKTSRIFMVLLILFILFGCTPKPFNAVMVRPASCSTDIQFAQCASLGNLLEFADKMQKPVFIDFYAPWVEPCKKMDQYVFTQDDVASYYNTHFINYKVNVGGMSPEVEIADLYGVTTFPTLLYLDGKGKIIMRHEGAVSAARFLEIGYHLHQALETETASLGASSE